MKCFVGALLILIITFQLPAAYAFTCLEKSQTYISQGEKYFELDDLLILNSKNKKQLSTVYDQITSDRWTGSSIETVCKGSDKNPRAEQYTFNIKKATFRQNGRSEIKASIQKKNRDNGSSGSGAYHLFGTDNFIHLELTGDTISSIEKSLQKIAGRSRFREVVTSLAVRKKTLTIEITYFSNGYSVGHETFSLQRK